MAVNIFDWKNSNAALKDLESLLMCKHCKKILNNPQRSNQCGHIFCKGCLIEEGKRCSCPICNIACKKVTNTHVVEGVMEGYRTISDIVGFNRERGKENFKSDIELNHKTDNKPISVKDSPDSIDIRKKNVMAVNSKAAPDVKKTTVSEEKPVDAENVKKQPVRKSRISRLKKQEKVTLPVINNFSDTKKNIKAKVVDEKPVDTGQLKTVDLEHIKPIMITPSKDILKRNNKGETPLHVACIKGNAPQVKDLLTKGVDPCTKDFAGWTPLHEAVSKGFVEIVELLLKAGALVNAPGCYNNTPLHEAVVNNRVEEARLLMAYGGDPDIKNIEGITPRCNATTELKAVFEEKIIVKTVPRRGKLTCDEVMILGCNFDSKQHSKLMTLVRSLKAKTCRTYVQDVSHIVSPTKEKICSPYVPVLQGILQGKWIVSFSWLEQCLAKKQLLDPLTFEITGTVNFPNSGAAKKGRINAFNLLPSLFNGCHFYLASGNSYTAGGQVFTKMELEMLIRSGDGEVLKREPNAEGIPPIECTVPYHANHSEGLTECSHYIIYQPGKNEPQLKYNMRHIKTLPISWFLECIETFHLIPV